MTPFNGENIDHQLAVTPANVFEEYCKFSKAGEYLPDREDMEPLRQEVGRWIASTYPYLGQGQVELCPVDGLSLLTGLIEKMRWADNMSLARQVKVDAAQTMMDAVGSGDIAKDLGGPAEHAKDQLVDDIHDKSFPILNYVPDSLRTPLADMFQDSLLGAMGIGATNPESKEELTSSIRAATVDDIDDLVKIELEAYRDVYVEVTPDLLTRLHDKFTERVLLLGNLVRVIEHPERGVYGMIAYCPTSCDQGDFLTAKRDMTSNEALRDVYDADGKNAYVVNLAILPEWQGNGDHFKLLADCIDIASAMGIKDAFFESRLPGLERWSEQKLAEAQEAGESLPSFAVLADVYWQLKRVRDGIEQPVDPLLRMYASFGCVPLRLVEGAWKPDSSSHGYGVLCKYTIPYESSSEKDQVVEADAQDHENFAAYGAAEGTRGRALDSGLEWAREHKRTLFLGATAVAGLVYSAFNASVAEVISRVQENTPWAPALYGMSWGLFWTGVASMVLGAGQKIHLRNALGLTQEQRAAISEQSSSSKLIRAGFWMNAGGAVGAAAVAAVAILEALPFPGNLATLTIPLADLYSTIVVRSLLYKKVRNHLR